MSSAFPKTIGELIDETTIATLRLRWRPAGLSFDGTALDTFMTSQSCYASPDSFRRRLRLMGLSYGAINLTYDRLRSLRAAGAQVH